MECVRQSGSEVWRRKREERKREGGREREKERKREGGREREPDAVWFRSRV